MLGIREIAGKYEGTWLNALGNRMGLFGKIIATAKLVICCKVNVFGR